MLPMLPPLCFRALLMCTSFQLSGQVVRVLLCAELWLPPLSGTPPALQSRRATEDKLRRCDAGHYRISAPGEIILRYAMLRQSLASDTANPTMKEIAKLTIRAVHLCNDASVGFALVGSISEPSSLLFYCCAQFHDLFWPTPNAPMSGAEVRSTKASAPLAG